MANTQATKNMTNARHKAERALRKGDVTAAGENLIDYFKEYARENPETTALWCFGIGFILGWKLKPW